MDTAQCTYKKDELNERSLSPNLAQFMNVSCMGNKRKLQGDCRDTMQEEQSSQTRCSAVWMIMMEPGQ